MRIGRADFEVGNIGRVHQAVLDAISEEEGVGYAELRTVYDQVTDEDKPCSILRGEAPRVTARQ